MDKEQQIQELRKEIAKYIAREMALSQTPAYSLNASEQSYGILNIIKGACYLKAKPDGELPRNKYICSMRVIGEPEVTARVQEEIKREIKIYSEAQQDMLQPDPEGRVWASVYQW